VLIVTVPVPPVGVAVICATFVDARAPPNVTVYGPPALPVTATSPTAMFDSASSADCTALAAAFAVIDVVVCAE
jgi:hypothetical protein